MNRSGPPRTRQPQVTQQKLLQAAREELLASGPTFSLEAVAKRAGVSKGGLLHHFPSREGLLKALALDLEHRFYERVRAAQLQEKQQGRGSWLRAYIQVSFEDEVQEITLITALVPLLHHDGALQELNAAGWEFTRLATEYGFPTPRAHAIRLACDGYWMGQMLPPSRLNAEEAHALREELLSWTR